MFLLFSAGTYVMYGDKYSLRPQTLRAIQVFDSSLLQDSSASSKYSAPFHWKSSLLLFITSSQSGRFVILWLYKFYGGLAKWLDNLKNPPACVCSFPSSLMVICLHSRSEVTKIVYSPIAGLRWFKFDQFAEEKYLSCVCRVLVCKSVITVDKEQNTTSWVLTAPW